MKVAIVAMLKDEASDVAYWMAWYLALGFDTMILFDDNSSDGTDEIIQAAARTYDVRYIKVIPNTDRALVRQLSCYEEALRRYGDEFDWIAFFDADEYLATRNNQDINSWLYQYENAEAVAVHWCNYGSNGHVLKPGAPAFAAFTRHGTPDDYFHHHIKTIARPSAIIGDIHSAHTMPVRLDRYVTVNGEIANWVSDGFTYSDADWSQGKLMHYQTRSMEHFIERERRREGRSQSADSAMFKDGYSQLEDRQPLKMLPEVNVFLASIVANLAISQISRNYKKRVGRKRAKATEADVAVFAPPVSQSDHFRSLNFVSPSRDVANTADAQRFHEEFVLGGKRARILRIVTWHGSVLAVDRDSNIVVHCPRHSVIEDYAPLYAVAFHGLPDLLILFSGDLKKPLIINSDERRLHFTPFRAIAYGGERVSLAHPRTGRFMCAVEAGNNHGPGNVVADRWRPNAWEAFTLEEETDEAKKLIMPLLALEDEAFRNVSFSTAAAWVGSRSEQEQSAIYPMILAALSDRADSPVFSRTGSKTSRLLY